MNFKDKTLYSVWQKVNAQERLGLDDVRTLYASPDILSVGWMAKQVKERRWGRQAFYVLNQKLEPTNVCVLSCKFCDFATKRNQPNAYEMTIDEMVAKCAGDISEIHISGGMPPEWTLENYIGIIRALRRAYPKVGIKAFTAVEVEWAARISKQSVESVLRQFKDAGLTALPGGGAEVFSERVQKELFPFKIGAREWLEVHRTAHRLGIPTNATLLYGHIETPEECWHHLELLRQLQDEAPGFMSFIPLAFQPGTTGLAVQPPTVIQDLKLLAISRLYLDNFPHIKAYWITLGEETASLGLHWGADDIDGTIGGEKIMHAAGAASPSGLLRSRLEQLIKESGCVPVERDAVYNTPSPRSTPHVTVGFIPYLNMLPFHQGFGPDPIRDEELTIAFKTLSPRALGLEAEAGRIDAGAMSLVDVFRLSETFEPLGDFGIGVKRAAGSVLLFSKKPLAELDGLCAVTDETATSVRLLQILLEKRHCRTGVSYGRIAPAMYDGSAEALLLIGDEALRARREGVKGLPVVTDLATEWFTWQGTPFVFARWMVRKGLPDSVKGMLERYLENSLNKTILDSSDDVLSAQERNAYWDGFLFRLMPEHDRAMKAFKELTEAACLTK